MNSYSAPQEAYYDDEIDLRELVGDHSQANEVNHSPAFNRCLLSLWGDQVCNSVPKFEASAKIALGTFSHDIYSNVATSRESW